MEERDKGGRRKADAKSTMTKEHASGMPCHPTGGGGLRHPDLGAGQMFRGKLRFAGSLPCALAVEIDVLQSRNFRAGLLREALV